LPIFRRGSPNPCGRSRSFAVKSPQTRWHSEGHLRPPKRREHAAFLSNRHTKARRACHKRWVRLRQTTFCNSMQQHQLQNPRHHVLMSASRSACSIVGIVELKRIRVSAQPRPDRGLLHFRPHRAHCRPACAPSRRANSHRVCRHERRRSIGDPQSQTRLYSDRGRLGGSGLWRRASTPGAPSLLIRRTHRAGTFAGTGEF
jgi:hypothetical protein